eukprot:g5647.t1
MASVAVLASVDVVDRAVQLVLNGRSRERHAGYVQLLGLLGQSEGVDYDEIFERVFVKLGNEGMRIALQDFGSIDRGLRITSGKVVVACLLRSLSRGKYFENHLADKVACVKASVEDRSVAETLYIIQGGETYHDLEKKWEDNGPCTTFDAYVRDMLRISQSVEVREMEGEMQTPGVLVLTGKHNASVARRWQWCPRAHEKKWGSLSDASSSIDPKTTLLGVALRPIRVTGAVPTTPLRGAPTENHPMVELQAKNAIRGHTQELSKLQKKIRLIERQKDLAATEQERGRLERLLSNIRARVEVANAALRQSGNAFLAVKTGNVSIKDRAVRLKKQKKRTDERQKQAKSNRQKIEVQNEMKRALLEKQFAAATERHDIIMKRSKGKAARTKGWKEMQRFFLEQVSSNQEDIAHVTRERKKGIVWNGRRLHKLANAKMRRTAQKEATERQRIAKGRDRKYREVHIRRAMEEFHRIGRAHEGEISRSASTKLDGQVSSRSSVKGQALSARDLREAYDNVLKKLASPLPSTKLVNSKSRSSASASENADDEDDDSALKILKLQRAEASALFEELKADKLVLESMELVKSLEKESRQRVPEPWDLQGTNYKKWPAHHMSPRLIKQVKLHLLHVAKMQEMENEKKGLMNINMKKKEIEVDISKDDVLEMITCLNGEEFSDPRSSSNVDPGSAESLGRITGKMTMLLGDTNDSYPDEAKRTDLIPHAPPKEEKNMHRKPFAHLHRTKPSNPGQSPLTKFRSHCIN